MKKFIFALLSVILAYCCMFFAVGCGETEEPPVTGVYSITDIPLNKELTVGATAQLGYSANPENATFTTMEWKSSVTAVAIIDNTGKITAVSSGRTTITLTVDSVAQDNFVLNVISTDINILSISISGASSNTVLDIGETVSLMANVAPEENTDSYSWSSSDNAVATVNKEGLVTALSAGSVTIKAKAERGEAEASVTIRVVDVTSFSTFFKDAVVENNVVSITNSLVTTEVASDRVFSVETYNDNKYVQLVNTYDNVYNTFGFECKNKFYKGIEYTLVFDLQILFGQSATGISICWGADPVNCKISTDTDEGFYNKLITNYSGFNRVMFDFVCPEDYESLYVYVCEANGRNIMAFNEIQIVKKSDYVDGIGETIEKDFSISISCTDNTTIDVGDTLSISAQAETTVEWLSSNNSIATVNANGMVTAIAEGKAMITAKSFYGLVEKSVEIKVAEVSSFVANLENVVVENNVVSIENSLVTTEISNDRIFAVEKYKNKNYIELTNAYDNVYNTVGFECKNKFYKGIEYTLIFNIQILYGQSAAGISVCWGTDPANCKIPTNADVGAYNKIITNYTGFNRIVFDFVCPEDFESLYVYVCEANGRNIMAFNEIQIVKKSDYVESDGMAINKYKEDFRFARLNVADSSIIDLDSANRAFLYAPLQSLNVSHSLESINGKMYFVKTNSYTDTYTINELVSTFAIEKGKTYTITIDYKMEGTHSGQFTATYAPEVGQTAVSVPELEMITKSGTDVSDKVSWTFTATKDASGILLGINDFTGNNRFLLSTIIIEEIILN